MGSSNSESDTGLQHVISQQEEAYEQRKVSLACDENRRLLCGDDKPDPPPQAHSLPTPEIKLNNVSSPSLLLLCSQRLLFGGRRLIVNCVQYD